MNYQRDLVDCPNGFSQDLHSFIHRFFGNCQGRAYFDGCPAKSSAPEYFSRLVREGGRPTGIYDPAIALTVQRILEAGREAVRSGCSTALPATVR